MKYGSRPRPLGLLLAAALALVLPARTRAGNASAPAPGGLAALLGVDARTAERLSEELRLDPFSPAAGRALTPHLTSLANAAGDRIAALAERPGTSVNYEASGGKEFLPELLSGAVKVGTDGGGAELNTPWVSYGVGADPNSRTLSATLSYGGPVKLASGANGSFELSARRVIKVEFAYETNQQFVSALGLDARNLPGGRTALQLVDRILRRERPAPPGEPSADAARAALEAVRDTLFPNGQLLTDTRSVTTASGVELTLQLQGKTPRSVSANGSAKLTVLDAERRENGQAPQQFNDVSVGVNLGGGVGSYQAAVGMTVGHTNDPTRQEPNAGARKLAAALRSGSLEKAMSAAVSKTAPVWDNRRIQSGLRTLLSNPRVESRDPSRIAVARDPKAGGVMLFFDSALLEAGVPPEELAASLAEVSQSLEAGKTQFAVRLQQQEEEFETLSLKAWAASGNPWLGSFTRIRGYLRKPDDLVLIGRSEPGRPRIHGALLTVALASIYRSGSVPFVSIDPAPADPYKVQRPRVGGLPIRHVTSEFTRIMLDADYEMKRLNLGEMNVEVPGFDRWYDVLQRRSRGGRTLSRFWLSPLPVAAGDVMQHGPVVIFESRVQVLTEQMKQYGELLAPTGESHPDAELAARSMTRHYEALAAQIPSFAQLHALFDIAKLCALLRHRQVKLPLLETLADRPVPIVVRADGKAVLANYSGIGPKVVEGASIVIGGGAIARHELRADTVVETPALAALLRGEAGLKLEPTVPLPRLPEPRLLASAAQLALGEGRLEECAAYATRVLEAEPGHLSARIYRSLARASLGQTPEALADLDLVVKNVPALRGFRGLVRLHLGDRPGARADVDAAVRAAPGQPSVWQWYGAVKAYSLDFAGAALAARKLRGFDPLSEAGYRLATLTRLLQRLGPVKAKERADLLVRLPIPLADAFAGTLAAMQAGDGPTAVRSGRQALTLSARYQSREGVRRFHAHERALFLLAFAEVMAADHEPVVKPGDVPGLPRADELIERHPGWASGYLLKAICAIRLKRRIPGVEPKALMDQAFARSTSRDPLLQDWEVLFGSGKLRTMAYATGLLTTFASHEPPLPYLEALAAAGGADGKLASTLLRALKVKTASLAVPILRPAADAAIASPAPTDPGGMIVRSLFLMFASRAETAGGLPSHGVRFARAIDRGLPPDHSTLEGLTVIGLLRMVGMASLMEAAISGYVKDPQLVALRDGIASGRLDAAALARRAAALAREMEQQSTKFDSPFIQVVFRPSCRSLHLDLQLWSLETASKQGAGWTAEHRSAVEELRSRLTDEAAREGDAQYAQRLPLLAERVRAARTPADLRTLQLLVQQVFTQRIAGELGRGRLQEAVRLQNDMAEMTARIRLERP